MSSKTSFSFEKELTPQQRKLRSWDLANTADEKFFEKSS
jgi:hypothetical protein